MLNPEGRVFFILIGGGVNRFPHLPVFFYIRSLLMFTVCYGAGNRKPRNPAQIKV